MTMNKKTETNEIQAIDPVFLKLYEICEDHGVSKEIIMSFLRYQGRKMQHAQTSKV